MTPPIDAQARVCMYCGAVADSDEHIIAVWIVELLSQDPRGLPTPTTLHVPLADGSTRDVRGRRRRGKPTIEYTTRICRRCNSGWMNVIDEVARPYLTAMIHGKPIALNAAAQAAVAAWITKVAVTARSAPPNTLPIEKVWTDWLYAEHSAPPHWSVSIGRYVGAKPFWYRPEDISVKPPPGAPWSAADGPMFCDHGVLAFLVLGHLAIQVFGTTGGQLRRTAAPEEAMIDIWPTTGHVIAWPPGKQFIDDSGLPLWASRFSARAPK